MSRARVAALALVNWKGVFYERYLLDKHVTALEGANGAGKTTVMIAAYIVLLPDMTRVRFTNLGESGATGGDRGIWGRLGEPGRPAYAALDLDVSGERLVLGVRLMRASEPTVELTAFVITGLAEQRQLSEVLLARRLDGDHVPELDEIKAQVASVGASIEVFRTTKDYFSALFERGITPLRLTGEAERAKWNDLLRTSMTGGISRALGSELRGFLLREETGLAGTLGRMRENLDACRRTRIEVTESRSLEREISATYEAGQAMFGAALHATRLADVEARERQRKAAQREERAASAVAEYAANLTRLAEADRETSEQSERTRNTLLQLTAARERRAAADACAERVAALDAELAIVQTEVAAVRSRQHAVAAQRDAVKATRTRALEAYDRASFGVVHMQEGLEELNRRAHAYRQLMRSLQEAREFTGSPALAVPDAAAMLLTVEEQCKQHELGRSRLEREGRDHAARQGEYTQAQALLAELAASSLWLDEPIAVAADAAEHARARALLTRSSELQLAAEQLPQLERDETEALRLADKQQDAQKLALSLATAATPLASSRHVADALTAAEEEQQTLDAGLRVAVQTATERAALETARERLTELELESARYRAACEIAARLETTQPLGTLSELLALRDQLIGDQLTLQASIERIATERDALQLQAAELTRGGALFDVDLLRLRDELGAELLAGRFEDLESAEASWVEARLGPWLHALVVEDPAAAAAELAKLDHPLETVHFVRAGALLELTSSAADSGQPALLCEEPYGLRVVRRRELPSLGRRARETKLEEMLEKIVGHSAQIEQLTKEAGVNAGRRRDSELLLGSAEVWLAGDPERKRGPLLAQIADLEQREREQRTRDQAARAKLTSLRARMKGLRRLLPDAQLLESPNFAQRAQELASMRARLIAQREELARLKSVQRELARVLDVLRTPPPAAAELARLQAELERLSSEHERSLRARAALDAVHGLRHALEFSDAQAALDTHAALSPALEAQHAAARSELQASEAAEADALAAWEVATEERQNADARLAAVLAHRDRALAELTTLGGIATEVERAASARDLTRATNLLTQLEAAARASVAERALAEERHTRAQTDLVALHEQTAAESGAAQPFDQAWQRLRQAAEAAGVLHNALAVTPPAGRGSMQLSADASSKRQVLLDRVGRTRGTDDLLLAITQAPEGALGYLDMWQAVRAWLGKRVPAQVAEVMDPLLALERLRDHLEMLESRLSRQEGDLRGSSEDVARGIEVQLRRALGQVRRLNQQLEGIHFGSVHGIRIELRRIERMDQILRALREGQAQDLLFSAALPIEEALDEIFKRYAGGGKGAGQRLLDYREYIELAVEVRRQTESAWEPANPTRLSTGEAIGVGAALMMVVLTQWEWDANLLRPRGALGSIRFLFLDEANRLSRDNLGVLFDLCRTLELQLLVAAPEVARADGNTTYRLVRHTSESGREEVIVSGRRALPTLPEAENEPNSSTEPAAEATVEIAEATDTSAVDSVAEVSLESDAAADGGDVLET